LRSPQREQNAKADRRPEREQNGFKNHLTKNAKARCSDGKTHGHLALTPDGLRKQQIGDIGAGDREHQQHNYGERCEKEQH
jgi:hypothetical protein